MTRSAISTSFPCWKQWGKNAKNARNHARNSPFPLRHVDFYLTYECGMPGPTRLTMPNDSSTAVHISTQRCNKVPIGYNGTPQIHPPNCPFPFDDHHQNLIHPYQAQPHSPPQTASGSNQSCCHCSHVRTDRCATWEFSNMSALLAILIDSDVLIIVWKALILFVRLSYKYHVIYILQRVGRPLVCLLYKRPTDSAVEGQREGW